jgi:hypothetical protein
MNKKGVKMFKKVLMMVVAVVIISSVFVSPVEAKPEDNWKKDVPPPPYGWDIAFVDNPWHDGDEIFTFQCGRASVWAYFYIDITMPPVPFPANYSLEVNGEYLASESEIFFEDSGEAIYLWKRYPKSDFPSELTVTLTLQAKGMEISKSEIVEVPCTP